MSEIPANPYAPQAPERAILVGRQAEQDHLDRYLTAPVNDGALLLTGPRHSGKTTLLRHVAALFDAAYLAVYVPLRDAQISRETDLWRTLAALTTASLVAHDFSASRLPDIPPETDRDWFSDVWLDAVLGVTHSRRVIVWLVDDAGWLLNQHPQALNHLLNLLNRHPSLKLVLAFDTRYATRLDVLATPAQMHRLGHLTAAETADLLRSPVRRFYRVSDEAAAEAYRLTGGQPLLAQSFAYHLFEYWQQNVHKTTLTDADARATGAEVYRVQADWLQTLWTDSSSNERLALRTISHLIFSDPLAPVTAERITAWLADSDYPLDTTAVNAAIRSLEYREILAYEEHRLIIRAGLFQQWLLERRDSQPSTGPVNQSARRYGVLMIALVVIIGLLLLFALSSAPRDPGPALTAEPTVTLVGP